ncbi:hypothetical protein ACIOTI_43605 [Streptomyces sp. NPDC087843]|uniref:hypothetical protein n=1 Tax=Streptomyces sp. NPDC087843 TaxID=3365804 RepID=UPI003822C5DD
MMMNTVRRSVAAVVLSVAAAGGIAAGAGSASAAPQYDYQNTDYGWYADCQSQANTYNWQYFNNNITDEYFYCSGHELWFRHRAQS